MAYLVVKFPFRPKVSISVTVISSDSSQSSHGNSSRCLFVGDGDHTWRINSSNNILGRNGSYRRVMNYNARALVNMPRYKSLCKYYLLLY